MNLKLIRRVSERKLATRQFVIVKKQVDVSFLCVCPVIDHEFRHHIVKVAVYPRGDSFVSFFLISLDETTLQQL